MIVLVTGSSGLIGKALVEKLKEKGHTVRKLVRGKPKDDSEFFWNYAEGKIDEMAFANIDSIIHLAGASIGERWTKNHKQEIISSRIDSADFLRDKCIQHNIRLKSFISASGINYYGTFTSDRILTEEDGVQQHDFLSEVCVLWENAAEKFSTVSERTVVVRMAAVLSKTGGSFEKLKNITDYNLAAPIGSGKQWFCWIHLDDAVNLYCKALEDPEMRGSYNAVADQIPTNAELMKRLAKARNKMFIPIKVPSFLLKIMLGEMSSIVLEGTRASNKKIKKTGFMFNFNDIDAALADIQSV